MSMRFIKGGLQTSIQDLGRKGQLSNGVANSGAMDSDSMRLANWLVSNLPEAPVLEITLIGPTIQFEESMNIAIVGATFDLFLNNTQITNNRSYQVTAGDKLEFKYLNCGARAYLAFSADLSIPSVLASYSTNFTAGFGGFSGRQLNANDRLLLANSRIVEPRKLPTHNIAHYSGNYLLRCTQSIESCWFDKQQLNSFCAQKYRVSHESNRMGIRLKGEPLEKLSSQQLISSGLTQGSIQIPASGLPIISSVDGQTIGGYPRIANVISADLPILGQLTTNAQVSFSLISAVKAIAILRKKSQLFPV